MLLNFSIVIHIGGFVNKYDLRVVLEICLTDFLLNNLNLEEVTNTE